MFKYKCKVSFKMAFVNIYQTFKYLKQLSMNIPLHLFVVLSKIAFVDTIFPYLKYFFLKKEERCLLSRT